MLPGLFGGIQKGESNSEAVRLPSVLSAPCVSLGLQRRTPHKQAVSPGGCGGYREVPCRRPAWIYSRSLQEMSDKRRHINQTTTNEDDQADYGNDVMFLDSRRERIERLAVEAFGPRIKNFFA